MSYRFTILGSGSSGGVPRIGNDWGACDPKNPKNRRRRSSFLIEKTSNNGATQVLLDTSPDLREQLLDANISLLDGVVYTHAHADHLHGIDDLRVVFFNRRSRIPVYFDQVTGKVLHAKFGYCFEQPLGSDYMPILDGYEIAAYHPFEIEGEGGVISLQPFEQEHGNSKSLGFRVGDLAYATDVSVFPEKSKDYLQDLDVLILDALRYTTHPCHFSVEQALEIIEIYKPKRAVLTHLHVDLDYDELSKQLPEHVEPAYDGLVIELGA